MLSLLQRIPSLWIALIVGAIGAALYLKYLVPKSVENNFVREKMSTIVLLYILFSRFSGLILHPSANIQEDLLSLLSGASSNGWLVGLIASVLYALLSFWRAKRLDRRSLFLFAEAVCSGSIIFFAYQTFTDLNPFRTEDILRIIGSAILIWLIRTRREQFSNRPQWLWGGYSLMLLLTSTYVPHLNRTLFFTTPQWIFVIIMAFAVYVEAKQDFGSSSGVLKTENNLEPSSTDIEGTPVQVDTKSKKTKPTV